MAAAWALCGLDWAHPRDRSIAIGEREVLEFAQDCVTPVAQWMIGTMTEPPCLRRSIGLNAVIAPRLVVVTHLLVVAADRDHRTIAYRDYAA